MDSEKLVIASELDRQGCISRAQEWLTLAEMTAHLDGYVNWRNQCASLAMAYMKLAELK